MIPKPARRTVEVRGEAQHFPLVQFFCLAFDLGRGVHDFEHDKIALALTQHEPQITDKTIADIKVSPYDAERPAAYPLVASGCVMGERHVLSSTMRAWRYRDGPRGGW